MRVAVERRADGVYVAAGVELIEPEYRHESARAPGGVWVTPSKVARLGDKLGAETAKRLASDRRSQFQLYQDAGPQSVRLLLRLRRRPYTRHCPACKREADRQRLRAKRRPPLPNSAGRKHAETAIKTFARLWRCINCRNLNPRSGGV